MLDQRLFTYFLRHNYPKFTVKKPRVGKSKRKAMSPTLAPLPPCPCRGQATKAHSERICGTKVSTLSLCRPS